MPAIQASPFAFPYEGDFAPARSALVIVDMQEDFLGEGGYLAAKGYDPKPLRSIIPRVGLLADRLRLAGTTIIWTRQGFRSDGADSTRYDRWRAARAGIELDRGPRSLFTRGSPGFEIVRELVPATDDVLIDKTANSAFIGTDFDLILRSRQITHLLFAGCTTDVCVHSTLREASDRKYQCLLIEDACASGDQYAHEAAVHMVTVEDGVFGVVSDSTKILAALHRSPGA